MRQNKNNQFSYNCILLNDTSYESHYGCFTVMKNLNKFLNELKINICKSVQCGKALQSYSFIEKNINLIDLIIINGEGTFHDDQKWAEEIVLFCEKIKSKKKLPILLLNALILNNSKEFMNRLNIFDLINVRDTESKKNIEKNKLKCIKTTDFSFYEKIRNTSYIPLKKNYILVNDSVNNSTTKKLFAYSIEKNYKFLPIRTFNKIKRNTLKSLITLIKNFIKFVLSKLFLIVGNKSSFNYMNYYSRNISEFLNFLVNSNGVLTGRFHSVCFCIVTKTPFVAISSNTPKIEILCQEIGLNMSIRIQCDLKKINEIPKFEKNELKNIKEYLKKSEDDFILLKKEIRAILP